MKFQALTTFKLFSYKYDVKETISIKYNIFLKKF